ncbi:hypothetical protein BH18THE2_BH18THE2_18620 [soil metagenome]
MTPEIVSRRIVSSWIAPLISGEREPLADLTTTDKEVKVILEMPGVSKENIKINASDNSVDVKSEDPHSTIVLLRSHQRQMFKQLNLHTKMAFLK